MREYLLTTIQKTFEVGIDQAECLYQELLQCTRNKNLVKQTVYYSANAYRPTIKWLFCTFEYFMHTFMHTDGYFYFMPQFHLTSIICC